MKELIPRQYLPAVCVIIAIIMSVIDGTIVNVALPSLTKEFEVDPDTAIWIVNAYQMVIMMFLLVFAAIGDITSYRKVFLHGIVLFTAASALCAFSANFAMLIASRVLQGIGAACIMSVNTALIRLIYPPEVLGRGMSVNAMAVAVSAAAGPVIAGVILSGLSWHWLFAINIPFGIITFFMSRRLLPENKTAAKSKLDLWSCAGNALTFGLMIYTLQGFAHHESSTFIAALLILLFIVAFLYVRQQFRKEMPLLPVDLLKIPIFALSIATSVGSFMAQMLAMVSLPFFLQDVMKFSPAEIGMLITPWPLATLITAPIAGRLTEKYHPGILGAAGLGIFASGLFSLYSMSAGSSPVDIIWRVMVCGAGFGLFQPPNNLTIVSSAPLNRSGGASGMLGMARLVGQTVGTTGVAILFAMMPHTDGAQTSLLAASIVAFLAGLSSFSRITQRFEIPRKAKRS